jgi:hypothetical protein
MLRTRPTAESLAAAAADGKKATGEKKGFFASMAERAETERKRREGTKPGSTTRKPGTPKPGSTSRPGQTKRRGSGGTGGGDPKKRPKR